MAIDGRIPLLVDKPDWANGLLNGLSAGQKYRQSEEQFPLLQTQLQGDIDYKKAATDSVRQGTELSKEQLNQLRNDGSVKSMIFGSVQGKNYLDRNDTQGFLNFAQQRVKNITERGGDPSDTIRVAEMVKAGQVNEAKTLLDGEIRAGTQLGVLKPLSAERNTSTAYNDGLALGYQGNQLAQYVKERTSKEAGGSSPYYTPVQTSTGIQSFDNRSGQFTAAVGSDGRALLPVAADAAVKGNITREQEQAKSDVERQGVTRANNVAFNVYETGMNSLLNALGDTTTGPVSGRIPAVTASQQIAEGAQSAMAPVLKQMFRNAGEGTFTDRDQEMLINMLPTRKDHPEAAKAKMQGIDAIVRAKLGGGVAPAQGSGDIVINGVTIKRVR